MKKSVSVVLALLLVAMALLLFTAEHIVCAIIGIACLWAALILFRYAEGCRMTQDERRGRSNRNVK